MNDNHTLVSLKQKVGLFSKTLQNLRHELISGKPISKRKENYYSPSNGCITSTNCKKKTNPVRSNTCYETRMNRTQQRRSPTCKNRPHPVNLYCLTRIDAKQLVCDVKTTKLSQKADVFGRSNLCHHFLISNFFVV